MHENVSADDKVFILLVDGVHCHLDEPKHPMMSKNPAFYSHKFNKASLTYELGISIFEMRLVWVNGPFPASRSDIKIFRENGLKNMIPPGKRIVGDNGYIGEPGIISTPNSHDPEQLRIFKRRVWSRHESFNSRLKAFKCLDVRFRHGVKKHKIVFEAICIICQYQLENGSPLFDA